MRAPFSKKTPPKDEGAVLLTTLLIMTTMAILAVVMLEDILFAVKRTAQIEIAAQADSFLLGADDYAQSYLQTAVDADNPAATNAQLRQGVAASFPLEGGVMNVSIRDSSNCLSLSLLGEADGVQIFNVFLETLGWSDRDAQALSARLKDWVDEDETPSAQNGGEDFLYLGLNKPHRAANTFFESVYELRALDIFEEREFQFLRPFICAHAPVGEDHFTQLNVNTLSLLQAPLLATALGSSEHIDLAENLIQGRPAAGWTDMSEFWAAQPFEAERGDDNEGFDQNDTFAEILLGVEPHHIWVDVSLGFKTLEKRAALEYRINDGTIQKSYRYFGDEAHWPRPINLLEVEP